MENDALDGQPAADIESPTITSLIGGTDAPDVLTDFQFAAAESQGISAVEPDVAFDMSMLGNVMEWLADGGGLLVAFVGLICVIAHFTRTMRSAHYSELDQVYAGILQMAIERPFLRDKTRISEYVTHLQSHDEIWLELSANETHAGVTPAGICHTRDEKHTEARQYDAYAFIVMNFLETIHDRCSENRTVLGKPDADLTCTWAGIIGAEYALHQKWFQWQTEPYDNSRNPKFCLGFCEFMWERRWEKKDDYWRYLSDEKIARGRHKDKVRNLRGDTIIQLPDTLPEKSGAVH